MDTPEQDARGVATPHATWHLQWQAAFGQSFLPNRVLGSRIRGRLLSAHLQRQRVLLDYLILPTEIHLVARLAAADAPGQVAAAIGNVVARWVREAAPMRSPVMAGPYQSHVLSSDELVRGEIRMLAWRPVVLGLCRGPTFHAHGALGIALGLRPARGFDARPLLQLFGEHTGEARAGLTRWIAERPSDLAWRAWELARGLSLAPSRGGPQPTGFRAVKSGEAAALLAVAGPGGVEGALGLLVSWVAWRLGPARSGEGRRSRAAQAARARAIVARLAVQHALCSGAFVARYFDKSKATLSEQVSASRGRDADSRLVATPMARIIEEMAALRGEHGRGP